MNTTLDLFRITCAVPMTRPGSVAANTAAVIAAAEAAAADHADIVLFPELCLTGYTCGDLFLQERLRTRAVEALGEIRELSRKIHPVLVVGLPFAVAGRLYNCAALVAGGEIAGLVPKTCIPNYHEYYERRWFHSGTDQMNDVFIEGAVVPFGTDLLFVLEDDPRLTIGLEICEDLWAPIPPSSHQALQGAAVLLNLSASNALLGKAHYRRNLLEQQSGRCLAAYAYCSAGLGESTSDTVFSGHCAIYENGHLLSENGRFRYEDTVSADIDLGYLDHERISNITFGDSRCTAPADFREIKFRLPLSGKQAPDIRRPVAPHPFVPSRSEDRVDNCREILAIQSAGLATRLKHAGIESVVIGLSGGLDSTLALLVCLEAFRILDRDLCLIHAITMPGFGTTDRTRTNAEKLCRELGVDLQTIDIGPACRQHFRDIGHDGITHDITYENTQARERTKILMNKANLSGGIVIGTGDLSELAMGWCTYNGDHMSMYAVNAGVPKTLVRYVVDYYRVHHGTEAGAAILADILDTPISPELLPPDSAGNIRQKTEETIGPYELHDFFLFHTVRMGSHPAKIAAYARHAFSGKYDAETIARWQKVFLKRFFSQQFKRNCIPDGPKVGTLALSPRADWRMPSDGSAADWLTDC